jgi:hypothetical protein
MASFPQKSGPVAFGRNGAFRDQKSRVRLPEHAVQGFEIMPVRQIDELAELRLDRAQGLHIQRLLIDGRRSGHRACGKDRQSEGGREKRLLHGHYPLRILNGDGGHGAGLSRLLGRIRGAPKRVRISAVGMDVQHGSGDKYRMTGRLELVKEV